MSDFMTKMHQIRFRLGLCPRPRWGGGLTALPRPPSCIWGPTSRGRGEGRERVRGRKGKWGEGDGSGLSLPKVNFLVTSLKVRG